MNPEFQAQLSTCDRERIHLIGKVQAHGVLLAFAPLERKVRQVSENAEALIGRPAAELMGTSLDDLFLEGTRESVLKQITIFHRSPTQENLLLPPLRLRGSVATYQGYLYRSGEFFVLEIEPTAVSSESVEGEFLRLESMSQHALNRMRAESDIPAAGRVLARLVRDFTGFDRVMIYRFRKSWEGEVIAEDKTAEAHSFMHHRFPATDIPLPARELYIRNRTRLIADREAPSVGLLSDGKPASEIDLTHSKIRAVSPIHLEYMKNMGVRASFSVAIVVEDRLWGLIACHGTAPTYLSHGVRLRCEMMASIFGATASLSESAAKYRTRAEFEAQLRNLFGHLRTKANVVDAIFRFHADVLPAFRSGGIALVSPTIVDMVGMTPLVPDLKEIAARAREEIERNHDGIFATERIADLDPKWASLSEAACGVLAFAVTEPAGGILMFFRPELIREIKWGGDPRKNLEARAYQGPINPRKSFESWTELIHGRSETWRPFEREGAVYLRDFFFDTLARKDRLLQEMSEKLRVSSKH